MSDLALPGTRSPDTRSDARPFAESSVAVGAVAVGIALLPILSPALPGNAAPVDFVLVLAIPVVILWASSARRTLHFPYVVPMAVLMGAGILAGVVGNYPERSVLALGQDILLVAWCAAVANVGNSAPALRVLLRTWCVTAIASAGLLIAAAATGHTDLAGMATEQGRAALTFGNPNVAADYFVISFMLVLAGPYPRRTVSRVAACALISTAVVMTGSLAGMGGMIVGSAIAVVVSIHRRSGPIPALATFLAMGLAAAVIVVGGSQYHVVQLAQGSTNTLIKNSLGRGERSSSTHSGQLRHVLDLYWVDGLLGSGPASTKFVLAARGAPIVKEAHDDYEATLVERGVLGVVGLALLIGAVVFRVAHIGGAPPPATAGVIRSTAPLVGAVAAVGFASLFHEVLHFRQVWTLFGLIAAVYLLERDQHKSREGPVSVPPTGRVTGS